jgi:hypothetical protein
MEATWRLTCSVPSLKKLKVDSSISVPPQKEAREERESAFEMHHQAIAHAAAGHVEGHGPS